MNCIKEKSKKSEEKSWFWSKNICCIVDKNYYSFCRFIIVCLSFKMNENEVIAINTILQQTHRVDDFRQDILDINQAILNFLKGGGWR